MAEKELTTTKALGNVKLFCKTNARMAEYHTRVHRQDKQSELSFKQATQVRTGFRCVGERERVCVDVSQVSFTA